MSRRMTTKQNLDALSSCSKKIKTNHDFGPWLDLNVDVLLLIMMQLGVFDFLAFSRVCKSWRSLAWTNRQRFMASKPPLLMRISTLGNKNKECYLEDYKGRKFKTILPYSARRFFMGLTYGYFILYKRKTREFWLVNPNTGHKLYFPSAPCAFIARTYNGVPDITAVLVFSPSISASVFVVLNKGLNEIWFCIDGEKLWCRVFSTLYINSLHVFNKKIYTLCCDNDRYMLVVKHLHELAIKPEPKLTLLETKNFLDKKLVHPRLVSWGENFYVMDTLSTSYRYKLDFGEMEWVTFQNTKVELAFFLTWSRMTHATGKQELWAVSPSRDKKFKVADDGQGWRSFIAEPGFTWYIPSECFSDNLLDK